MLEQNINVEFLLLEFIIIRKLRSYLFTKFDDHK